MNLPSHGLRCGQLVDASDATIRSLADDGAVDPHEDAVAYAEAHGAELVELDRAPPADEGAPSGDAPPQA